MPRISQLADDFADRFAVEPARAQSVARYLREAGILPTGARGVNASPATTLDAAHLLIGLMLVWKRANFIAADVQMISEWSATAPHRMIEQLEKPTFGKAFAHVLDWTATLEPKDLTGSEFWFPMNITIAPTRGLAIIQANKWNAKKRKYEIEELNFTSTTALTALAEQKPISIDFISRNERGFNLEPSISYSDIVEVAHVVAGSKPLAWRLP